MIVATLAFSMMQVGVKYLSHIPFHELILFRSGISLVLSLAWIVKVGLNPFGNNRPVLIQRGIYGTIALSLLFLTIQKLPLASAAFAGRLALAWQSLGSHALPGVGNPRDIFAPPGPRAGEDRPP